MKDAVFVQERLNIRKQIKTVLLILCILALTIIGFSDTGPMTFGIVAPLLIVAIVVLFGAYFTSVKQKTRWRIILADTFIELIPDIWNRKKLRIPLENLTQIRLQSNRANIFTAQDKGHRISTYFLDMTPDEILRLLEIRLEKRNHHLVRDGADHIYKVQKGNPYEGSDHITHA